MLTLVSGARIQIQRSNSKACWKCKNSRKYPSLIRRSWQVSWGSEITYKCNLRTTSDPIKCFMADSKCYSWHRKYEVLIARERWVLEQIIRGHIQIDKVFNITAFWSRLYVIQKAEVHGVNSHRCITVGISIAKVCCILNKRCYSKPFT